MRDRHHAAHHDLHHPRATLSRRLLRLDQLPTHRPAAEQADVRAPSGRTLTRPLALILTLILTLTFTLALARTLTLNSTLMLTLTLNPTITLIVTLTPTPAPQ